MKTVIGIMEKLVARGPSIVNTGKSTPYLLHMTIGQSIPKKKLRMNSVHMLAVYFTYVNIMTRRYVFGDVHLGQSCRVKSSSADLLLKYV